MSPGKTNPVILQRKADKRIIIFNSYSELSQQTKI